MFSLLDARVVCRITLECKCQASDVKTRAVRTVTVPLYPR